VPAIRMTVIAEPADGRRAVLMRQNQEGPLIQGEGDLTCLCGSCGFVLLKDMDNGHVFVDVVFKCPTCESFNEIPSTSA